MDIGIATPLAEVADLTVRFVTRDSTVHAVNGVSFAVHPGEVLCILGESGSGKSVTLRALMRLLPRRARFGGSVRVAGQDVLAMRRRALRDLRGGLVSMVFQEPMTALDPVYTIGQQIGETVRQHTGCDRRTARAKALELLELVRVPSAAVRLDAYPHELSGGLRQRAMIAMALSCGPRLLLADEPTTALDATVQIQVLILLRKLQRELGHGHDFRHPRPRRGSGDRRPDRRDVCWPHRGDRAGRRRVARARASVYRRLARFDRPRPAARGVGDGDSRQSARFAPPATRLRLRSALLTAPRCVPVGRSRAALPRAWPHGPLRASGGLASAGFASAGLASAGRRRDANPGSRRAGAFAMKLNGATIPGDVVARVLQRRGTLHCFATLDPARTALVVIDLQRAFMDDSVGHAVIPAARDIVPDVNRLAAAVRGSGGGVFWVKNTHDERCLDEWSVAQAMATPAMRQRRIEAMSADTPGHALWPTLDVRDEDPVVLKYRYSAFLPGASELPVLLRVRGFDTVLITGTVTNVCCEFLGTRCHDDKFPHHHGERRQRRGKPGRA